MRGENSPMSPNPDLVAGSPPHARGKPFPTLTVDDGLGITPACAGKTVNKQNPTSFKRDHPRMRGENSPILDSLSLKVWITPACAGKTTVAVWGSSKQRDHPRMRGENVEAREKMLDRTWITPACAGKTRTWCHTSTFCEDHPRMRGENVALIVSTMQSLGSPPHARGKLIPSKYPESFLRITPACAGKTLKNP